MGRVIVAAVCAALAAALIGLTDTWLQPADDNAIAAVRSLDDALNTHDADGVVSRLANGASLQQRGKPRSSEQLHSWADELIRQDVQLVLIDQPLVLHQDAPSEGTLITWRARLDLQSYRTLGLQFIPATLHADVEDGSIVYVSIRTDPDWNGLLNIDTLA
jgi:hypothetical protein